MSKKLNKGLVGDLGKVSMCKRVLKHQTSPDEEIPFFKISTFGGETDTFIPKELFELYKKNYSYPKVGDILISAAGTIGKTVIFDGTPSYFQDSNIVWVDNDESKVLNSFLYYYYQTEPWIATSGSTIKRLYNDNIRNLQISYPDKDSQKKIAKVLSDLDAKIELNSKINYELEAMAKLFYDYWFVQFDFPISRAQAEAMGRPELEGRPYKSSGGKMVYDERVKREIPEGWEVRNLLGIADLKGGGTPDKANASFWNGDIPFYTPSDFQPDVFITKTENYITSMGLENSSTKLFERGTIFITARGSVGNVMIVSKEMAMNQSCYALVPKKNISSSFLYFTVIGLVNYLKAKSSGSVFKSIITNDIKLSLTAMPPPELIHSYGAKVEAMFSSILNRQMQNEMLRKLRDWLLPMLMNGQVRVGENNNG